MMEREWLQGERVRLRALEPEDLTRLYRWENNSAWWETGNTVVPYSRYLLTQYIEESHRDIYESKQQRFMIAFLPDGETVGMIDLFDFDPRHRRAGVGILIDTAYRRRRIAREALELLARYAFRFLRLHQLYAHVSVRNEASRRLFSSCGFAVAGRLADWSFAGAGYADVLIMQRVDREEEN